MASDGSVSITSTPWSVSDERPNVYAVRIGIWGYGDPNSTGTSIWYSFSDCKYICLPATMAKNSSTSASGYFSSEAFAKETANAAAAPAGKVVSSSIDCLQENL